MKNRSLFKVLIGFMIIIIFVIVFSSCGANAANITIKCMDDSNNYNALVVKIYQLKNSEKLKHSKREDLLLNPEEILSDELISYSKFEKTLVPGEIFILDKFVLAEEAKFLGIVGDFHTPIENKWYQIYPLESGTDDIKIVIGSNFIAVEKTD